MPIDPFEDAAEESAIDHAVKLLMHKINTEIDCYVLDFMYRNDRWPEAIYRYIGGNYPPKGFWWQRLSDHTWVSFERVSEPA